MNWKEHAHLFANGEFSVNLTFYARLMEKNPYEIIGIRGPKFIIWDSMSCEYNDIGLEDCTLIARKIEDMTDEEKLELARVTGWSGQGSWYQMVKAYRDDEEGRSSYTYTNKKIYSDYEESLLSHLTSKIEGFLHILSIGILPEEFEEGFEDGTIIDVKAL